MRKLIIAVFLFVSSMVTNSNADGHGIKMGIILGFTGPIESLTPAMAASAELAFKEASDSGSLLGGKKISVTRADSTCVDSAAAVTAAEGLVSGGAVAITLPTASSGEDGVYYKFIVEEETPSNDITIGAGSAIISLVAKDAGGDLAVSTAGTQVSNVILDTTAQKGDYVEFMFTKGEYVASSMSGINNGIQTS